MSDQLTLAAETRDRVGKGASRALRRDGRVPAVIYGGNQDPAAIHLEEKALVKALMTGHFMNSVVMVGSVRTLPKDVTLHPVTERPVHVDFLRIGEHASVTVEVPVVFTGEENAPGLKKGGVLNVVRHEIEVTCDAGSIPSEITVVLDGKDVGDSIHLSDLTLPEGVSATIDDRDFTVATLVAPSAMKSVAGEDVEETEVTEQDADTVMGEEPTDPTVVGGSVDD